MKGKKGIIIPIIIGVVLVVVGIILFWPFLKIAVVFYIFENSLFRT